MRDRILWRIVIGTFKKRSYRLQKCHAFPEERKRARVGRCWQLLHLAIKSLRPLSSRKISSEKRQRFHWFSYIRESKLTTNPFARYSEEVSCSFAQFPLRRKLPSRRRICSQGGMFRNVLERTWSIFPPNDWALLISTLWTIPSGCFGVSHLACYSAMHSGEPRWSGRRFQRC